MNELAAIAKEMDKKCKKEKPRVVGSPYFGRDAEKSNARKKKKPLAIVSPYFSKDAEKNSARKKKKPPAIVSPYFCKETDKNKRKKKKPLAIVSPSFTEETDKKKKKNRKEKQLDLPKKTEHGETEDVFSVEMNESKLADVLSNYAYKANTSESLSPQSVLSKNATEIVASKKRKRQRRSSEAKVPGLSAAQKRDEAYLRKTPHDTWDPPPSEISLLQHAHAHDPWRVLLICMLLNRTTGLQVCFRCVLVIYHA